VSTKVVVYTLLSGPVHGVLVRKVRDAFFFDIRYELQITKTTGPYKEGEIETFVGRDIYDHARSINNGYKY